MAHFIIVFLAAATVGALTSILKLNRPVITSQNANPTDTSTPSSPTATPTPGTTHNADPIFDQDTALRRARALTPPDFDEQSTAVVLVNYDTIQSWSGKDMSESDPLSPVWLVAFEGNDLDFNDVVYIIGLPAPSDSSLAAPEQLPIGGVYYYFDANGGHLAGVGILTGEEPLTVDDVRAIQAVAATIVPATDLAPVVDETPTP